MISFLKGTLVGKMADSPRGALFWVDVHGVGFEVLSSRRSVESAAHAGEAIQLYTSLVVREDSMTLVGFNTHEERDLFNILQSASGVGVKVALALLSALSVSEIAQAVVAGNHKPLTQAKGVGPKLAQKMTLDLKEKMMSWRQDAVPTTLEPAFQATPAFSEAEAVLLSLGYSYEEVVRSFKALQQNASTTDNAETILKESLHWLATQV